MSRPFDVTVIGAGPYGLSAAAELRAAGADVRVHGSPMSFWTHNMPRGMLLRSPWAASHIGAPHGALSLGAFESARGRRTTRPVPLSDFVAYGHWFRERAVPDIDERRVERVEPIDGGFRLLLADGEPIESRRVVVAAGIEPFAKRPAVFDGLPPELASHSSRHEDLSRFAGKRVVVIGRGQSGSEFAVLLHERGADVEVIARGSAHGMRWVGRAPHEGIIGRLLFDRTDVGPLMLSHLIARPTLLQRFPAWVHRESVRQALDPGASLWLRPRAGGVVVTSNRQVVEATRSNGRVALRLDDGSRREADHVLLATGYRIDVRRYPFLGPALAHLRCVDDHPVLDAGFQSSIRGLYFVGAPAMQSFGPLLRFVSGTEFATRALARSVTRSGSGAVDADGERSVEMQRAPQRAQ